MIRTGLERLLSQPDAIRGRCYGLLSNTAARSADGRPVQLALLDRDLQAPDRLLGPEHGFHGVEQDMVPTDETTDPWSGIPIISLYGRTAESLVPEPGVFDGLDLLIIDLQDVGSRYYTYAASAIWSAKVALEESCEVWILDRPNPLGGATVEGNLVQPGFESFVGAFRVPVRHGLTLGELARLEARRSNWPDGLKIWEVEGWSRDLTWNDFEANWVPPSPNLPSVEATILYPGLCLVEGTGLSEGRGTTRPFQLVGAPGVDGYALVEELDSRELSGVGFTPTFFRPQFQKHAGKVCGGVEIRVTDPGSLAAYRCGVELILAFNRVAPDVFTWRGDPYEFVSDQPAIDLLTGDRAFRDAVEGGELPTAWLDSWPADEASFRSECAEILVYPIND